MITFIDLAGHHKYLKTTIFGLTSYCPDFAMLVVSANTGIGKCAPACLKSSHCPHLALCHLDGCFLTNPWLCKKHCGFLGRGPVFLSRVMLKKIVPSSHYPEAELPFSSLVSFLA